MKTMETIKLDFTRSGDPALWEEGGGFSNTGWATVVASPEGPQEAGIRAEEWAVGVRTTRQVPVEPGDHVVVASHHRWDYTIRVYRILEIKEGEAILQVVAEFAEGGWNPPLPDKIPELQKAVEVARYKARCYHCREPHYVAE